MDRDDFDRVICGPGARGLYESNYIKANDPRRGGAFWIKYNLLAPTDPSRPRFGELWAVLLELPIMLAISWWACGQVVTRFHVPPRLASRAAMGALAFGFLMLAEAILSVGLFGRSMSEYAGDLTTPHGLVGLGGQVAFALMPLVRR